MTVVYVAKLNVSDGGERTGGEQMVVSVVISVGG
jgi:hypothetical protein